MQLMIRDGALNKALLNIPYDSQISGGEGRHGLLPLRCRCVTDSKLATSKLVNVAF